jgi:hypothetical protein
VEQERQLKELSAKIDTLLRLQTVAVEEEKKTQRQCKLAYKPSYLYRIQSACADIETRSKQMPEAVHERNSKAEDLAVAQADVKTATDAKTYVFLPAVWVLVCTGVFVCCCVMHLNENGLTSMNVCACVLFFLVPFIVRNKRPSRVCVCCSAVEEKLATTRGQIEKTRGDVAEAQARLRTEERKVLYVGHGVLGHVGCLEWKGRGCGKECGRVCGMHALSSHIRLFFGGSRTSTPVFLRTSSAVTLAIIMCGFACACACVVDDSASNTPRCDPGSWLARARHHLRDAECIWAQRACLPSHSRARRHLSLQLIPTV